MSGCSSLTFWIGRTWITLAKRLAQAGTAAGRLEGGDFEESTANAGRKTNDQRHYRSQTLVIGVTRGECLQMRWKSALYYRNLGQIKTSEVALLVSG